MAEYTEEELQRAADELADVLQDIEWRTEPLHERDCPACDIAADIAGTLACVWDPNGQWCETPVTDGLPGDSLLDQATRCAAHVLHRRLPGHGHRTEEADRG
ncbi:hypothetical protein [Amycolatopsis dendrobii]|uniref:Uncharacterized protein n=1 Tax=Amycolatopsis dendrobii TaxID=2760662 RepID=A0A7W3VWH1_9PSEU|nr:hypothetical protein [Amycolatopsis dendrobii]MBB1153977.1 hypothetical protein [Amycolatopsis dendrobii]